MHGRRATPRYSDYNEVNHQKSKIHVYKVSDELRPQRLTYSYLYAHQAPVVVSLHESLAHIIYHDFMSSPVSNSHSPTKLEHSFYCEFNRSGRHRNIHWTHHVEFHTYRYKCLVINAAKGDYTKAKDSLNSQ